MNPPGREDGSPTLVRSQSESNLAVIDFEPNRLALRPIDLVRYAIYGFVIVVLAATSAYMLANRGARVYGARSEILFERRTEQSTGFLREDRSLTTQLVTLKNRTILGPVAAANGLTVDELAKKVHASIVDSSEIIRIQVDDASVARGKKLVDAISKQYLKGAGSKAPAETQRFLQGELAQIDRDLETQTALSATLEQARLQRVTVANPNPLPTAGQTLLDARIKSLLDRRTEVNTRLEAATIDFINQPRVAQITSPYQADGLVSPHPLKAAAAGGLAGGVVAVFAIAVLARRRGQSVRKA